MRQLLHNMLHSLLIDQQVDAIMMDDSVHNRSTMKLNFQEGVPLSMVIRNRMLHCLQWKHLAPVEAETQGFDNIKHEWKHKIYM